MKLKLIPMFFRGLGLLACLTGAVIAYIFAMDIATAKPITIRATSNYILAENTTSLPPLPELEGIDLTPKQQAQIEQIFTDLQPQFKEVLPSPPQLTAEEEAKIQQIVQPFRTRLEAVLTPEQLQQLKQNLANQSEKPAPAFGVAALAKLNLTKEQQEQIKQINQEIHSQLQAALPSPPQLTTEAKKKIQELMQTFHTQVEAILTPEQQEKFRQNLEQFRQNESGS